MIKTLKNSVYPRKVHDFTPFYDPAKVATVTADVMRSRDALRRTWFLQGAAAGVLVPLALCVIFWAAHAG